MELIKREWKLFWRSIHLPLAVGALLLWEHAVCLKVFTYDWQGHFDIQPTRMLRATEPMASLVFVVLLFVSFLFFRGLVETLIEQLCHFRAGAYGRMLGGKALVLTVCLLVVSATALFYDLLWNRLGQIDYSDWIWHILRVNLLDFFLPGVLAILLGAFLSLGSSRVGGYSGLLASIFLFTPILSKIVAPFSYNINLYRVTDMFAIFPPNLNWAPDPLYGFAEERVRWITILFWILLTGVGIYVRAKKRRGRTQVFVSLVSLAICVPLLVQMVFPGGIVRKPGSAYSSPLCWGVDDDLYYYSRGTVLQREKEPDFSVTGYDMDIKIGKELKAVVRVKIEGVERSAYFTLYHGYRVSKVTDQDGNSLPYMQQADSISVQPSKNTRELIFHYQGHSTYFFSNEQAVFLPAYFSYYPVPGYQNLFYSGELVAQARETEYPFRVAVHSPKSAYLNLPQTEEGVYSGRSTGVSILSGFAVKEQSGPLIHLYSPLADRIERVSTEGIAKQVGRLVEEYHPEGDFTSPYPLFQAANTMGFTAATYRDHAIYEKGTAEEMIALQVLLGRATGIDSDIRKMILQYLTEDAKFKNTYSQEPIGKESAYDTLCRNWCSLLAQDDKCLEKTLQHLFSGGSAEDLIAYLKGEL